MVSDVLISFGLILSDVASDSEHARCVVEFFADIFTNTLKDAAALAVTIVAIVMDQIARKRRALRFMFLSRSEPKVFAAPEAQPQSRRYRYRSDRPASWLVADLTAHSAWKFFRTQSKD